MDQADVTTQPFGDLLESILRSPIATIVTDRRQADNPIIAANDAFIRLTGYARGEIIGRNCRFLAGPATEPEAQAAVRRAIALGQPIVAELINYRKDGTPFRNALMIAPVRDASGAVALFLGSQMEVSDRQGGAGFRVTRAKAAIAALTPRLRQVLELMSVGYRSKQIGGALGIGEKTVKMHRARLKEALGVKTSADAIRIAIDAGLIASDPCPLQIEQ
ncbi:MAG TPA: PAS domain-containing protein [Sphingomicrobium sp.]